MPLFKKVMKNAGIKWYDEPEGIKIQKNTFARQATNVLNKYKILFTPVRDEE
jgi:hypothetical protein